MKTAKVTGQLAHHFWGEYCCDIVLICESAELAGAVKSMLPNFKQSKTEPTVLGARLDDDRLEIFKAQISRWNFQPKPCGRKTCRSQCRDAAIDSINHSIDSGPLFTLEIPVEDSHQSYLPLATLVR